MFGVKLRLPAANRPNFAPLHDPHERLNEPARLRCPIYSDFATACHWSVNPCEYAADVVFRRQAGLQAIYRNLTLTAIRSGLFQAPPRGRTPDGFQPALPGGSAFLRLQPARPPDDENPLCSIVRGEFNISGLQNKTLRRHAPEINSAQMSRARKRLRGTPPHREVLRDIGRQTSSLGLPSAPHSNFVLPAENVRIL